jgi:hypothetical protein
MVLYPDTQLREDREDDDFGGRPAAEFGGLAWAWANAVLVFLGRAHLTYARVPWTTVVAVSRDAALAGQVAVFAPNVAAAARGYTVVPYGVALSEARVVGIYLESCGPGARARLATGGLVPPTVSGLGTRAAPVDAGLDATTGRVRVAEAGDLVLGRLDLQGHLLFTAYGAGV